jgi:ubiquinone/menaquinone biosynthesis C-methylase UbiE
MDVVAMLLKRLLRLPADALLASSTKLPSKISESLARHALGLSGRFYPYEADQESFILRKLRLPQPDRENRELPIPPQELWEGYGTTTHDFLNSGNIDVGKMRTILGSSGFSIQDNYRVLELGCASGRMLRWLHDIAETCEVWGVDISARHILWCQKHLSPPFNFATVTTAPHLPFEDGYFDLIYCGSVFTHIEDLSDAWLLELKRIVKPDGRIYITVHDKYTLDLIINHPDKRYSDGLPVLDWFRNEILSYDRKEKFLSSDFDMFTMFRGPASQVFYDVDYLCQHWGRILCVLSITPEAYGYQTAILLTKKR